MEYYNTPKKPSLPYLKRRRVDCDSTSGHARSRRSMMTQNSKRVSCSVCNRSRLSQCLLQLILIALHGIHVLPTFMPAKAHPTMSTRPRATRRATCTIGASNLPYSSSSKMQGRNWTLLFTTRAAAGGQKKCPLNLFLLAVLQNFSLLLLFQEISEKILR